MSRSKRVEPGTGRSTRERGREDSTSRERGPDESIVPSSWIGAVPLGALLAVGAIWIAYPPSPSASDASSASNAPPASEAPPTMDPAPASEARALTGTADLADLAGFRSDAWFLPDEELLGFVEIPAGPFVMGSDTAIDAQAYDNERWGDDRQGTVDLPAFYIGRYEVTVAQFRVFAEETGYPVDDPALRGPPDHPVVAVSWTDALAYSRWLERTLKQSSRTPPPLSRRLGEGWRVKLPSEAEWEKAARGVDGRIYPWGDEPRGDRANYEGQRTRPVGDEDCPECSWGLSDMSGNVWELTRSPYEPYPYDPTDDGENLAADALWVMRGGSFRDPARSVRAAARGGVDPGARRPFIGFRVVISRF